MNRSILATALLGALLAPSLSHAAASTDPEWPCIQRKVPDLSIAQVWNGADLPASARDWSKDPALADLVRELAARRNPLEAAEQQLKAYAASLPRDQANDKLAQVFQGLFETLDHERQQVIVGIARYAGKQRTLAAAVRKEASEVDKLRRTPDTDAAALAKRSDQLAWETRIFQERVQSLSFVCEVPTIIEQRLYGLSKILNQLMIKP